MCGGDFGGEGLLFNQTEAELFFVLVKRRIVWVTLAPTYTPAPYMGAPSRGHLSGQWADKPGR